MGVTLLVGNGINRLNNSEAAWEDVLKALCDGNLRGRELEHIKHKPFALLYEEILLAQSDGRKIDDFGAKKKIATLVDRFKPNSIHERIMNAPVKHIFTTNYDYTLERAWSRAFHRKNIQSETKYSLFRYCDVGRKRIWHIHGESQAPNTITLGYDQYSGYLQKMRTFATAERSNEKGSPFKRCVLDFEDDPSPFYSWLDVFFRDDVHIIGLGLDFTEIDLWWALTYKRRLEIRGYSVGETHFHEWHSEPAGDTALAKKSLLEGLGVFVWSRVCADGFENAYDRFLRTTLCA